MEEIDQYKCIGNNLIPGVGGESWDQSFIAFIGIGLQITGIWKKIWNKIVKRIFAGLKSLENRSAQMAVRYEFWMVACAYGC